MEAAAPGQPEHSPAGLAGSAAEESRQIHSSAWVRRLTLCRVVDNRAHNPAGAALPKAAQQRQPQHPTHQKTGSMRGGSTPHQRVLQSGARWSACRQRHACAQVTRRCRSTQLRLRLRLGRLDALGSDHLRRVAGAGDEVRGREGRRQAAGQPQGSADAQCNWHMRRCNLGCCRPPGCNVLPAAQLCLQLHQHSHTLLPT